MEALRSLGIDFNGLVLHLVNFGILLLILLKFFYKPILKFIDERRESIRKNLEEAELLRQRFQAETEARETEKQQSLRLMQKEVSDAKAHADGKARALLGEAEIRKEEMLDEARGIIDEMKKRLGTEVEDDVKRRMEQVVLHVLANQVPEEVVRKSIESAWNEMELA